MDRYELPAFMNRLANSHEIIIDNILEKKRLLGIKTFGGKITKLKETIESINTSFDKLELIQGLREFNDYWIITKHGMEVLNATFVYVKDGIIMQFTDELIKIIGLKFTENQKKLIELSNIID